MKHTFVGLPAEYEEVMLIDSTDKKVRQVLWGDWLWLDDSMPDTDPEWRHVVWSPNDPANRRQLRIKRAHTADQRPLEIIFVDVGQGDGAVLITPERDDRERVIVIDAGKGPEMAEFLESRFRAYRDGFRFHAAVITHPDQDHYLGLKAIFANPRIRFDHVYHSGLVERPTGESWAKLGGTVPGPGPRLSYLEGLVQTDAELRAVFAGSDNGRDFAETISAGIDAGTVASFDMLSNAHGTVEDGRTWMPGFAPSDPRDYAIEVLGPVVERADDGRPRLRRLGDYGVTKNGHSVILRLTYRDFTVLFGGDLNRPAEKFLLQHYGEATDWPDSVAEREAMLAKARMRLRSDVMKVCHHGASDVTDEFLEAVDPAAFVISSGDQEGYVHPRPDLLGRLGKKGRGSSPVLLSTELQRSTRAREDGALVAKLRKDIAAQLAGQTDARAKAIDDAIATLGHSNVDVDGAIYLKTDGQRLITAFKKETDSPTKKWFYFEYRILDGALVLEPR